MYLWIKAFHLIAAISWMVGLLYLPRLYVYHAMVEPGSARAETFSLMERRLLKAIMTPAMIVTFILGIWMIILNPGLFGRMVVYRQGGDGLYHGGGAWKIIKNAPRS